MNAPLSIDALIASSEQARDVCDHVQGLALAEQALQRADITAVQQARARAILALHALRLDDFETAIREGLLALQHQVDSGNQLLQSRLHATLAFAYNLSQLHQQALWHATQALETARACGDLQAECWAMNRAAMVYEGVGEHANSLDFGQRSLALARSLENQEAVFAGLNNLASNGLAYARFLIGQGDKPSNILLQAAVHAEQAVALACESGAKHREAMARSNLAPLLQLLGRIADARVQMHLAIQCAHACGYTAHALDVEFDLLALNWAEGHTQEAITQSEALLARVNQDKDPTLATRLHTLLYEMHKAQAQFEPALRHFEHVHALTLKEKDQMAALQSRVLLNKLALDEARHQAEQSQRDAVLQRMRAEELDRAAHSDALTGLLNRRFLDRQLPLLMSHAKSNAQPLAAAMIDIDHFKQVNDSHGHDVGDQVLAELAVLLRQATRGSDMAVRLGGEEFLVVLVNTPFARAIEACERLRDVVQTHPWHNIAPGLVCTISIGLTTPAADESKPDWLKRTDAALYAAKHHGRNRVMTAAG